MIISWCNLLAQARQPATPPVAPVIKAATFINAGWLAAPTVLFVVVLIYWTWRGTRINAWIDGLLKGSRRKRGFLLVTGNLVVPAICAVAFNALELPDVIQGNVRQVDLWALCILAIGCASAIIFQLVLFHHEDQWEQRIERIRCTADLESQRHVAIQSRHQAALAVNNSFRGVVELKAARLRELSDGQIIWPALREALAPELQVVALLECVYEIYRFRLSKDVTPEAKLTLMYFEARNGYLEPVYCTDGIHHDENPTLDPCYREYFCLNKAVCSSFAVFIAKAGEIGIIENAEEAELDGNHAFHYFPNQARTEIQSMLVLPILDRQRTKPAERVVCLYTDRTGFFTPAELDDDRIILENLEDRLLYEKSVDRILQTFSPASANGTPNAGGGET